MTESMLLTEYGCSIDGFTYVKTKSSKVKRKMLPALSDNVAATN